MRISSDEVPKNPIRDLEKTILDIINNTNDGEEITLYGRMARLI